MFKVEITEEYAEIQGTGSEILAGLVEYIDALRGNKIPDILIKKAIEMAFEEKKDKKVETILDNDKMKIQKFDLNNMSKEEAIETLKKEIFDMLD